MQTIQLPHDLEAKLAPLAKEQGRSIGEYVINLLNDVAGLDTNNQQTTNTPTYSQYEEFNFDLERMKDRVENQEFHTYPKDKIEDVEDFRRWLGNPKADESVV